ncbi:alkaline phosphatase family protein [uncultured Shimia sp.]|uniref:alkaline phosphatase family protein n=1 Tax=uncultured Shimia sp. TaxID=573152 RepID=UPI0026309B9A|nr:alkaline phosphatase family protein [uncultured Shimia sp.]
MALSSLSKLSGAAFAIGLLGQTVHADTRLIVQITVDGLRGDLLSRYKPSFSEDGFMRLINNGVWYTDAHHDHANTETIVGHATLATGAHPSEHGMIGNAWFDTSDGRLVYNIEDANFPLLPLEGFDQDGAQVDATQAAAQSDGRSPLNILASTFGDELIKSNNGMSKVFSVSGKDRSSVSMAGKSGKAFWMSTDTGAYQTSAYYYDTYPDWVREWNAKRPADAMIGQQWALHADKDSYLLAANDDRDYETDLKGFGVTFPHTYGTPEDGLYYTQLLLSPLGDKLTAEFGKAAVLAESLGQDAFPDYLSLSFSGVDASNHFFGPSSLESEEMVRVLDLTLADLFGFLDAEVGRDNVLYILSADHGMPEMPEFMANLGHQTARNGHTAIMFDLNAEIEKTLGVENAIRAFFRPYIYYDHANIAASGVDPREIDRLIVQAMSDREGIAIAVPKVPMDEQRGDFVENPIRNNFHPARSGDVYVVQSAYSFLLDPGAVAVMHGSPWRYDTHVPVIFSGENITTGKVDRRISTTDVAVTLADLFGTTQPSGASGRVLPEVSK